MTDVIFQRLEEKTMVVLSEIENLRKEVQRLSQENAALRFERENSMQKLQGLISLLDTLNLGDNAIVSPGVQIGKPVLVQG